VAKSDSVSSKAQELWEVFMDEYPELIYGSLADIYPTRW
jgi:hypothetical protein